MKFDFKWWRRQLHFKHQHEVHYCRTTFFCMFLVTILLQLAENSSYAVMSPIIWWCSKVFGGSITEKTTGNWKYYFSVAQHEGLQGYSTVAQEVGFGLWWSEKMRMLSLSEKGLLEWHFPNSHQYKIKTITKIKILTTTGCLTTVLNNNILLFTPPSPVYYYCMLG